MEAIILAMLGLSGIDNSSSDTCIDCEGGITKLLFIESDGLDLAGLTGDADGCVTGVTVSGSGFAAEYIPDADNTAFMNFDAVAVGGSTNYTVDGFAKFRCVNKTSIVESNKLKRACNGYMLVEDNSCNLFLVGVDFLTGCSITGEYRNSKEALRILPSVKLGTGAEESRIEMAITGTQRCIVPVDTDVITYEDIKTLLGL